MTPLSNEFGRSLCCPSHEITIYCHHSWIWKPIGVTVLHIMGVKRLTMYARVVGQNEGSFVQFSSHMYRYCSFISYKDFPWLLFPTLVWLWAVGPCCDGPKPTNRTAATTFLCRQRRILCSVYTRHVIVPVLTGSKFMDKCACLYHDTWHLNCFCYVCAEHRGSTDATNRGTTESGFRLWMS